MAQVARFDSSITLSKGPSMTTPSLGTSLSVLVLHGNHVFTYLPSLQTRAP